MTCARCSTGRRNRALTLAAKVIREQYLGPDSAQDVVEVDYKFGAIYLCSRKVAKWDRPTQTMEWNILDLQHAYPGIDSHQVAELARCAIHEAAQPAW